MSLDLAGCRNLYSEEEAKHAVGILGPLVIKIAPEFLCNLNVSDTQINDTDIKVIGVGSEERHSHGAVTQCRPCDLDALLVIFGYIWLCRCIGRSREMSHFAAMLAHVGLEAYA